MSEPQADSSANVPSGFILKLYQMVNGAPNEVISWTTSGDAFIIGSDLERLESETLPRYFRHNRFQSLVRQLNFYSFRKINRERNVWVYKHPLFHRDRPEELHLVRRRTCPGIDGRKQRFARNRDAAQAGQELSTDDSPAFPTNSPTSPAAAVVIPSAIVAVASSPASIQAHYHQSPNDQSSEDDNSQDEGYRDSVVSDNAAKRHVFVSPVLSNKRVRRIWGMSETDAASPPPNATSFTVDTSMVASSGNGTGPSPSPTSVFLNPGLVGNNDNGDGDDSSAARRSEKIEMMEQSLVVSKVAMKLEEYARKAMKERGFFRVRRGGGGVITPPWGSIQTFEGVNQGLLTYDDEQIPSFSPSGNWNMTGSFAIGEISDSKPPSTIMHKSASLVSLGDSDTKPEYDELRVPPVKDARVIESVASSLFPSILASVNVTSVVVKFCMSTPAYEDEWLHSKIRNLISESVALSSELRNYRSALHPLQISGVSSPHLLQSYADLTSVQQLSHLDHAKPSDMTRDFKIFAVNRMRKMLAGRGLPLSEEERAALSHTADVWWKSVR